MKVPPPREKINPSEMSSSILKSMFPFFLDLKLVPRQIKFVIYYVEEDWDASSAHIKAGYTAKSKGVRQAAICQLLARPDIKEAISKYTNARLESVKGTLDQKLVHTLYWRSFYDIKDFYNIDGRAKSLDAIPEHLRICIDGIEVKYYGKDSKIKEVYFRLADKDRNLEKLSKFSGINSTNERDFRVFLSEETEERLEKIFKQE